MTEVVQRLGLNETYTVRKGLKDVELYKSSPLAVTYRHLDETPVGFTIDISSKETFVISDMEVNGESVLGKISPERWAIPSVLK